MGLYTTADEVLEVRFTRNEEILTDAGEHLGSGGGGVCLCHLKGEFLAFTGANEAKLHLGGNVSRLRDVCQI